MRPAPGYCNWPHLGYAKVTVMSARSSGRGRAPAVITVRGPVGAVDSPPLARAGPAARKEAQHILIAVPGSSSKSYSGSRSRSAPTLSRPGPKRRPPANLGRAESGSKAAPAGARLFAGRRSLRPVAFVERPQELLRLRGAVLMRCEFFQQRPPAVRRVCPKWPGDAGAPISASDDESRLA